MTGRQNLGCDSAGAALQAIEITKRHWDGYLSLDAVSLAVAPGEIYCLVGAAGAGKTLILHILLGLIKPTAGRAEICGFDVARAPSEARRRLTYVAAGASLYGTLTARQNVEFFTRLETSSARLTQVDYDNAMRTVGIAERYFDRRARELGPSVSLSLWLAIGLLKNTPVLLFDEPTVGLDLYASAGLQETLAEFRERGKALLIVTSDILLASGIADRVGIIKEGRKRVELSKSEFVGRALPELYLEVHGPADCQAAGACQVGHHGEGRHVPRIHLALASVSRGRRHRHARNLSTDDELADVDLRALRRADDGILEPCRAAGARVAAGRIRRVRGATRRRAHEGRRAGHRLAARAHAPRHPSARSRQRPRRRCRFLDAAVLDFRPPGFAAASPTSGAASRPRLISRSSSASCSVCSRCSWPSTASPASVPAAPCSRSSDSR